MGKVKQTMPSRNDSALARTEEATLALRQAREQMNAHLIAAQRRGFKAWLESDNTIRLTAPSLIEDKGQLIGVPIMILAVQWQRGDYGADSCYFSFTVLMPDNELAVINDGGTGMKNQVAGTELLSEENPMLVLERPVLVPSGLRASEYVHPEHGKSQTWYFDGRKPRGRPKSDVNGDVQGDIAF